MLSNNYLMTMKQLHVVVGKAWYYRGEYLLVQYVLTIFFARQLSKILSGISEMEHITFQHPSLRSPC